MLANNRFDVASSLSKGGKTSRRSLVKKKLFTFWDKSEGYFKEARDANLVLKDERADMLKYINSGNLVLDVASGSCENGKYISLFAYYIGTDISSTALRMAQDYNTDNFDLIRADVETLPFVNESFDVVLSTYSLEHFLDPKKVIDGMYRVCKKGGRIILIAPAYDSPLSLPPSVKGYWNKINLILKKCINQLLPGLICSLFVIINSPNVLDEEYQIDNDAVYLVLTKQIKNYLTSKLKMKLIHSGTNDKSFFKYWKEDRLYIIVEKTRKY